MPKAGIMGHSFRKILASVAHKVPLLSHISDIRRDLAYLASIAPNIRRLHDLQVDDYLQRYLYQNQKYKAPGKLNLYERQVFSQNGEDGIIEEIFRRIGTNNKMFIEFGAGTGLENNTVNLLIKGWNGLWIDSKTENTMAIQQKFKTIIAENRLKVRNSFITAENIQSLFESEGVPKEPELLSIDIDRNDYWVWKAITDYRPRVVTIEYNAIFGPSVRWVIKYEKEAFWDRTSYANASLKSLEILGAAKGYKLVGCNFTGINAFFVREDLVETNFCEPFTSENHWEPCRLHLIRKLGPERNIGEFLTI